MKKLIVILMAILMVGSLTTTVMAQNGAVTTQNNVGATIVAALTLENPQELNFGMMSVPTAPATVTVTPDGVRSNTTTFVNLLPGTEYKGANFNVAGGSNYLYFIKIPSEPITIKNGVATDAATMIVDNFKVLVGSTSGDGTAAVSSTLAGGADTFKVGATLNLVGNQATGTYTGKYPVIVYYN